MGTLGSRGAGVTDYYGIEARRVDMIVSTMSNAWASAGGFCAGSMHVVDHQRLSGAAYCFSASLPAMLAVGAHEAINVIEKEPEMVTRLHENVRYFHQLVKEYLMGKFEIEGDGDSPVVHLRVNGEEDRIKRIVDECAENGYLVTVAKYSEQERIKRRKSIRIAISGGHSFEQIKGFVECLSKIEPSKIELPKIEIAKIE
ncbi:PLP-dependent transferase [Rozella allomycis CSF55]|uniref:serine C-palmitoyltransferase n=1 Tax=Rozella allomycis (strain CSF55) TaxID=988480 RepID=A0A075B4H2_ROZAC|nr:Pyridoxal phosphate-dependent transferase domain-containing protein 2 [Rozella allomycis CSF55]RKP17025.1 PLP-dependent transferase [Rozella allomycis CSF55]|eukprot:EPZ36152.1 Pyridoxal phosphate-dependent transferase domain-containing protein 2 [Rozella allomycis CSF55]